jgi:hypothetical protein
MSKFLLSMGIAPGRPRGMKFARRSTREWRTSAACALAVALFTIAMVVNPTWAGRIKHPG